MNAPAVLVRQTARSLWNALVQKQMVHPFRPCLSGAPDTFVLIHDSWFVFACGAVTIYQTTVGHCQAWNEMPSPFKSLFWVWHFWCLLLFHVKFGIAIVNFERAPESWRPGWSSPAGASAVHLWCCSIEWPFVSAGGANGSTKCLVSHAEVPYVRPQVKYWKCVHLNGACTPLLTASFRWVGHLLFITVMFYSYIMLLT